MTKYRKERKLRLAAEKRIEELEKEIKELKDKKESDERWYRNYMYTHSS